MCIVVRRLFSIVYFHVAAGVVLFAAVAAVIAVVVIVGVIRMVAASIATIIIYGGVCVLFLLSPPLSSVMVGW